MRLALPSSALVGLVLAVPASAGCINFEDGSSSAPAPTFEICYDGSCDVTAMEYECANAGSYQLGFDVGWAKFCTLENGVSTCEVLWQQRAINPAKQARLTCRPLSGATACNFP